MPVVAHQTFNIRANQDLTIDIIPMLKKHGCIILESVSKDKKVSKDDLRHAVEVLGSEVICDSEICCIDKSSYFRFVNKIKKMRK